MFVAPGFSIQRCHVFWVTPPRGPAHTGARRVGGGNNWPRVPPGLSLRARGSKCHTFTVSPLEPGRAPTASMPAAARPHFILGARDLEIMALGLGRCRWSANLGRLFVVYHRILLISI